MEQSYTTKELLEAYKLITIQITQNGKGISEGSVPEDAAFEVVELLSKKLDVSPPMVFSYENVEEFVLMAQKKTADETKQLFEQLPKKDKMEFFIRVSDDAYDDDDFTEEEIETFKRLGITDDQKETTETLKKMFNIEFNLVINGAVLPLS
ncbi:hypothetical protein [Priestia megaterium]|uniref:Uncharacterized protein n=1 Tax=Priestia megaterium TaxID=1404 RepID=A0A6M6E6D0_PRIMG|nr:hypothetical protein [Priestia megaterium]QJX80148.1 hypothetical protein FDZ14_29060 [Priestia megaterium]